MIYHLECYNKKYQVEYRDLTIYCPPFLVKSATCDYCHQEIKKGEYPARENY